MQTLRTSRNLFHHLLSLSRFKTFSQHQYSRICHQRQQNHSLSIKLQALESLLRRREKIHSVSFSIHIARYSIWGSKPTEKYSWFCLGFARSKPSDSYHRKPDTDTTKGQVVADQIKRGVEFWLQLHCSQLQYVLNRSSVSQTHAIHCYGGGGSRKQRCYAWLSSSSVEW